MSQSLEKRKEITVRSNAKMTWRVDAVTLEALSTSCYDPWCYSDPKPGIVYMEESEWQLRSRLLDILPPLIGVPI